ncbi:Holliday junction resolvase [Cotia virus SPAn232]|uniref:Holliday junction resolvase n=2 Tax=Cotia virus TaxID=39444 RepID=H6TAA1_9POXV|nr:Holliday junction resolvase [Cotia virus SPAn232]ADT91141.1 Holliday junction resolvase [Cotia virus SPAn232]AIT70746.1 Holliday junction resolvase [Cotia virus]
MQKGRYPAPKEQKEIICAFDIGAKNPARTIIEIENNSIKIIDISKLDWSIDWEKRIARDISQYQYTLVLLERQPKRSPYVKFVYFIKGFLYNTNTNVICVSPVMSGNSYKDRKRRSVETFKNWMEIFGLYDLVPNRKKLDDVADSFNLAMRYILNKWNIKYIPYIKM